MRKHWRNNIRLLILLAFLATVFVECQRNDHVHEEDVYVCPMHPTVTSNKPANCPVCGMELVRKNQSADTTSLAIDLLAEEPNEVIHADVVTTNPQLAQREIRIDAHGIVTYDTRFVYTIPVRTGGRLEKVYAKFEYYPVNKGQRIADIYSPELVVAQREYLYLLEKKDQSLLLEGARRKLEVLGFTGSQIENLERNKNLLYSVSIHSPHSGYILASDTPAPAINSTPAVSAGMGMGSTPARTPVASDIPSAGAIFREGQYVQAGQPLVRVVSDQALRIELNLPSPYISLIHKGESVHLDFGGGHAHTATIDFVEPFFSEGQEFLKVRVYTTNMANMHIGHLVDATVTISSAQRLWVPEESVINLGVNNVVFVRDGSVFRPRQISTGIHTDGWIEVTEGISTADTIAAKAGYLVDSESFIHVKDESK